MAKRKPKRKQNVGHGQRLFQVFRHDNGTHMVFYGIGIVTKKQTDAPSGSNLG